MQVLAEANWDWMLYGDGERRWLAIVCGSVGLYELVIELDPEERARLADDPARLGAFAREVSGAPRRWSARHRPGVLDTPAARLATERWRASAA